MAKKAKEPDEKEDKAIARLQWNGSFDLGLIINFKQVTKFFGMAREVMVDTAREATNTLVKGIRSPDVVRHLTRFFPDWFKGSRKRKK
jgi:hypothetical protein